MQHLLKFTARHRQWMIVLGAAFLSAACQSTVSIEEAKNITTSVNDAAFVPPPRSIRDITAILDEQELVDPEKTFSQMCADRGADDLNHQIGKQ